MTVVVIVVELLRLFQTKHELPLYCIKFINITFLCFITLYYITLHSGLQTLERAPTVHLGHQ